MSYMSELKNYIVIYDKGKDFCRLFRSDSDDLISGEILWSGDGLRNGYDAMIRLNKERKPITTYFVCEFTSKKGHKYYRVLKNTPDKNSVHVATKHIYAEATQESKRRNAIEKEKQENERKELLFIMERVGIKGKRVPKFTDSDLRYIDWLKSSGKLTT